MNTRALKKEWKRYRKDCKKQGIDFISLDAFIEKVYAEQDNDSEETFNEQKDDALDVTTSSVNNDSEDEEDNEDDIIDLDAIQLVEKKVKTISTCTCEEVCPCHELDDKCSCEDGCPCIIEKKEIEIDKQLTFDQSQNYEQYLEDLPKDVKYSELEPDLWRIIKNTDTFKKSECFDIQTVQIESEEILEIYKNLFKKKPKKKDSSKKSTKGKKATNKPVKVTDEKKVTSKKETTVKKTPTKKATTAKKTPAKKATTAKKKPATKTKKTTKK